MCFSKRGLVILHPRKSWLRRCWADHSCRLRQLERELRRIMATLMDWFEDMAGSGKHMVEPTRLQVLETLLKPMWDAMNAEWHCAIIKDTTGAEAQQAIIDKFQEEHPNWKQLWDERNSLCSWHWL